MVPVRLRQVIELVLRATQRACCHGVQQRLPQVGARAINECDARTAALAEGVAKLRGEFQAACTAAYYDDVRQDMLVAVGIATSASMTNPRTF